MKAKILLVDDEVDILLLLKDRLEDAGYEVQMALDAGEARELLKEGKPDLIVLDVMLPEVSGYTFCRQLKAAPETRDIPVVMLTVRSSAKDKEKGLEAGAVEYITKPFEGDALLEAVAKHLKKPL